MSIVILNLAVKGLSFPTSRLEKQTRMEMEQLINRSSLISWWKLTYLYEHLTERGQLLQFNKW